MSKQNSLYLFIVVMTVLVGLFDPLLIRELILDAIVFIIFFSLFMGIVNNNQKNDNNEK